MEDDRLGKTLAITSLYPEKPHPHSRSSRIPQIPQGAAFLPGGQLERAAPTLARPSTPASAPSSPKGNYPRRGLEPAARNPHPGSRTACNRRAAPLPSIVGAGSEDPCAICPEICGVTRLEPYVATRRGGGRLAEGSSSHISWCVHCIVWFLYLRRCRSRGHAVQGATRSGRTAQTIVCSSFCCDASWRGSGGLSGPHSALEAFIGILICRRGTHSKE